MAAASPTAMAFLIVGVQFLIFCVHGFTTTILANESNVKCNGSMLRQCLFMIPTSSPRDSSCSFGKNHNIISSLSPAARLRSRGNRFSAGTLTENIQTKELENVNGDDPFEVWLDLRGTALSPRSVLELWSFEERQRQPDQFQIPSQQKQQQIVNPPFTRFILRSNSFDSHQLLQNDQRMPNSPELLFCDNNDTGDDEDIGATFTSSSSNTTGKILSLRTSPSSPLQPILPNPLPAMDIVSKGQWAILNTKGWKGIPEEERIDMTLASADLIHSGAVGNAKGGGGIGWTCFSSKEVIQAAMWIQSKTVGGSSVLVKGKKMKTKMLDSGILIPDEEVVSSNNGLKLSAVGENLKFAIIVPYDVDLLRTATFLMNSNDEY